MIHYFEENITHIDLPERFTCPFYYTPHRLCVLASESVQRYLQSRMDWDVELRKGKMFGVLVVRSKEGVIGFLAAFSGLLDGQNNHPFFVPPVFDMLQPTEYFRQEEAFVSELSSQIRVLESDEFYLQAELRLTVEIEGVKKRLLDERQKLNNARQCREVIRCQKVLGEEQRLAMVRESQFQKAEFKRLEFSLNACVLKLQSEIKVFTDQINRLKCERRKRSIALQRWLFTQFRILNARGGIKNLCDIFSETKYLSPPAGAAECAAPKLLQYAYSNGMKPLAMAEFWWGDSPKGELRRHGYYYPACKGKCEPILQYMLQGLDVEENPLDERLHNVAIEIVFEDEYLLVINKPVGMLSVPGKGQDGISVYSLMQQNYLNATGLMVVHRLDMATSGLLLLAKSKEVHKDLQMQFSNRLIKKRYIALLDGIVLERCGVISLPLSPDILDRPRQRVDRVDGKQAVTRYEVLSQQEYEFDGIKRQCTRVAFYPETGRTHQLRVHSAHLDGLNIPIVGDTLYGVSADRLYLHAEELIFIHPITKLKMVIQQPAGF